MAEILTQATRNTDPITSHLAIEALTKSGKRATQQMIVEKAVRANPGRTAAELAKIIKTLDHIQVQRRLSDLDFVAVVKGERRKCSVKGSSMCTWKPFHD